MNIDDIFDKLEIGEGLKPDDRIYKYIGLDQFIYMLENNKIYLTRCTSWEDTWEVPELQIPILDENNQIINNFYNSNSDLFAQCWTLKEESDAMWRIYSPFRQGIKIGTSINKLELIEGLYHSAVNKVFYYNNLKNGIDAVAKYRNLSHLFSAGLLKRDAFEHEKEIRLITSNNEEFIGDKVTNSNYIEFKVNINKFIEEIILDPRCKDYFYNTICKYCKRIGLEIKPKKSDLYESNIKDKTKLIRKFTTVKK